MVNNETIIKFGGDVGIKLNESSRGVIVTLGNINKEETGSLGQFKAINDTSVHMIFEKLESVSAIKTALDEVERKLVARIIRG